jgi:Flp pilus assembly pilin Flp
LAARQTPFGSVSIVDRKTIAHFPIRLSSEIRLKAAAWHDLPRSSQMELGIVVQYATTWFRLKTDCRAVTALEYGLIAGVIVATIAVGFAVLANDLSTQFTNIGGSVAATQ